jgi:cation:H+ antiporter
MKVRLELVRREMPVMIGVSLLLILMLADGRIGRLEGVLLVLGLVAYTVVSYRLARQVADPDSAAEFAEALPVAPGRAFAAVAMIVAGLAALLAGANLLIQGAVAIASALGVSPAVIGLSVVAIGTSLPELATSVMAAARDEPDVAFGNVVGSNIFNILMVVGLAAVIQPLQTDGVRAVDLAVMLAVAVVALPMMRRDWRLSRIEGALLLAGYGVYLATLTR